MTLYPTIAVQVAFTTDPLATPTWTTLAAADVRALDVTIGKQDALDKVQPGTVSVELDNSDRTYDPLHAGSPYAGNLTPGKRMRVTATYGGTTYELFNGFVDGWPQSYAGPSVGLARLRATDASKYLTGKFPTDPYAQAVEADSPDQWYRFEGASGTKLSDSEHVLYQGTWARDLSNDHAEALTANGRGSLKLPALPSPVGGMIRTFSDPVPFSVEFWFRAAAAPKADYGDWAHLLWGGGLGVSIGSTAYNFGYGAGIVRFLMIDSSFNGFTAETSWGFYNHSICDGERHHVVCTWNAAQTDAKIYVDGVDQTKQVNITAPLDPLSFVTSFELNALPSWDGDAYLDELAIYSGVEVSQAQAQAHYEAGTRPWEGDTTGTRFGRILDMIGWPAGLRDIDTGQTELGVARLDPDETVTGYFDKLAASEQGRWNVAHHDAGKITFRDRAAPFTDLRSAFSVVTFTDDPNAFAPAVHYDDIELAWDESQVVRTVTVKWRGGEVTVTDPTLTANDVARTATIETELEVEDVARNLGQYVLDRYSVVFARVKSVEVRPNRRSNLFGTTQDDAWEACLGLREGDRVTVRVHPQNVGAAVSFDCFVEGIKHQAANGVRDWSSRFYLSPLDTAQSYWLLDSGALDSTTVLSF